MNAKKLDRVDKNSKIWSYEYIKATHLISWLFLREQQQVHSAPVVKQYKSFLNVIQWKHKSAASLLYSARKWAHLHPQPKQNADNLPVWRSPEHIHGCSKYKSTGRRAGNSLQTGSDSRDSWDSGGQLCRFASILRLIQHLE